MSEPMRWMFHICYDYVSHKVNLSKSDHQKHVKCTELNSHKLYSGQSSWFKRQKETFGGKKWIHKMFKEKDSRHTWQQYLVSYYKLLHLCYIINETKTDFRLHENYCQTWKRECHGVGLLFSFIDGFLNYRNVLHHFLSLRSTEKWSEHRRRSTHEQINLEFSCQSGVLNLSPQLLQTLNSSVYWIRQMFGS